ncbi:PAAR domain-containing protein [Pseudomonas sp. LS1212]|uniref:PAAR domain-containing protein n=1 Tax=Pseudomonas sp. LS1212 TaxID=2972478 RepID=UPI00215BA338|nr:PAAR domain-containing protein [Pseudomonas sp. LS1212]UVJ44984.1 PAAR domain-containing protein [Pseudomonas sp. LS1212]
MADGHFIRLGDKTTCGGTVQEADTRVMMFGIAHAREGDRVTCGKDGKTYVISGGVPYINSHGRLVAGTLDSVSTCPCKATLIPSFFKSTYESSRNAAPPATRTAAQPAAPAASNPSTAPRHSSFAPPTSHPAPTVFGSAVAQEPGFYIVPHTMSGEQVLSQLNPYPAAQLINRIKQLNPSFGHGFKAGELFVLGDPYNPMACTREEAAMMAAATQVREALAPLSEEEANFMARHLAEIALLTGGASEALGVGKDMLDKGLKQVEGTLRSLELLHQREFLAHGHLRSKAFFDTRSQLYSQLDAQLKTAFLNKQLDLGSYDSLRRDLGISTGSPVHHWSRAGASGQILGYATYMEQIAKAAKYLKYGGYIGVGLGAASSYLKVQEVCRAGETQECKKIRFTETGSFAVGLGGGAVIGGLGSLAAPHICAAIGLGTGGIGGVVCVLVVVGGASYFGGAGGGATGERAGEFLYEQTQP